MAKNSDPDQELAGRRSADLAAGAAPGPDQDDGPDAPAHPGQGAGVDDQDPVPEADAWDAALGAPDPHLAEAMEAALVEAREEAAGASPPPPATDAVWPVYAAVLVAVAVAALLAAPRLLSSAERKAPGPERELMLALGRGVHGLSAMLGLSRPYELVVAAVHPPDEGFASAAELARRVAGTARPTPARPSSQAGATSQADPTSQAGATAARPTAAAGPRPGAATATPGRRPRPGPRARPQLPPGERPPPPPPPARAVSAEAPLAVHVAGDSFAQPLAYELTRLAAEEGLLAVDLDFKLSSGVSRLDFFDWPSRLAQTQAEAPADVLVFNVGGNDTQPIWALPDRWIEPGGAEWQNEYGRRAGAIMDSYEGPGVHVYWVGIPVLRDEAKSELARLINQAVAAQAARRPWVRFVDVWPLFMDDGGAYNAYLPDESGESTLVRQNDGVHLTRVGTNWVAARLYEALKADWELPAPAPTATVPAATGS